MNNNISGWWWLEHNFYDFPYIGNVIIPTDEHIFQRGWNHQPVYIRYMGTPNHGTLYLKQWNMRKPLNMHSMWVFWKLSTFFFLKQIFFDMHIWWLLEIESLVSGCNLNLNGGFNEKIIYEYRCIRDFPTNFDPYPGVDIDDLDVETAHVFSDRWYVWRMVQLHPWPGFGMF